MFLQAAEMSGMKAQFDLPGFTASILAPSDVAFTTFLKGTESVTAFYVPYIAVLCNDVTVFLMLRSTIVQAVPSV